MKITKEQANKFNKEYGRGERVLEETVELNIPHSSAFQILHGLIEALGAREVLQAVVEHSKSDDELVSMADSLGELFYDYISMGSTVFLDKSAERIHYWLTEGALYKEQSEEEDAKDSSFAPLFRAAVLNFKSSLDSLIEEYKADSGQWKICTRGHRFQVLTGGCVECKRLVSLGRRLGLYIHIMPRAWQNDKSIRFAATLLKSLGPCPHWVEKVRYDAWKKAALDILKSSEPPDITLWRGIPMQPESRDPDAA